MVNSKQNTHVPFLDYDQKSIDTVLKDLRKLVKRFHLRNGYIFQTRNGFHAIFPYDVRSWVEVKKIIKSAKIDWRVKSFCDEYGKVFLRVAGKYKDFDIKFDSILQSPYEISHDEKVLGDGIIETHLDLFKMHNETDFHGMLKN